MQRRPSVNHRILGPTLIVALTIVGCGGEGPVAPNPTVADLVASWDAIRFVVQDPSDPEVQPDLVEAGMRFFLDVQPSGNYTATLTAFGQPNTEFGRIEIRGTNELIFHREQPGPPRSDTGTFRLSGDTLFVTGQTEFDFDQDGAPDPANLFADLLKRR